MPNGISLVDAQTNYSVIGAKDAQALKNVRFPGPQDQVDPDWRAVDLDIDDLPPIPVDFDSLSEPEDPTTLYYWTPSYWQSAK